MPARQTKRNETKRNETKRAGRVAAWDLEEAEKGTFEVENSQKSSSLRGERRGERRVASPLSSRRARKVTVSNDRWTSATMWRPRGPLKRGQNSVRDSHCQRGNDRSDSADSVNARGKRNLSKCKACELSTQRNAATIPPSEATMVPRLGATRLAFGYWQSGNSIERKGSSRISLRWYSR